MSKLISILAILFSFVVSVPVQAGSGHAHDAQGGHSNTGHSHGPISSKKAGTKAVQILSRLIKKGKLDKSWVGLKPASIEKKKFKQGAEWVVTFTNKKVKDKTKQKLYTFFSLDGHYVGANFTGN